MFSSHSGSMRSEWRFPYNGAALIEPTKKRLDYHQERCGYWTDEADSVEDKIKKAGVNLVERSATGGARYEAQIDVSLSTRLSEARNKRDKHKNFVEQFTLFLAEFQHSPNREYNLQIGDLIFFGLSSVTDEDQ